MEIDRHEDETGEGPGTEVVESDSGDSLFLTQKPVPQAVRTRSSPRLSQRSTPISPRFLEDRGSSSESEDGLERRKKRPHLPKFSFPFLKQKKSKSPEDELLGSHRNTTLHYYAMAGFFNCVREMWPNGKRSKCFESTLPTADAESEEITPISEEEKSDDEDIKIIDKKLFVYSLKPKVTKSSQLWFKHNIEGNENNKKAKLKAKATKTTSDFSPEHHFGNRKMLTQPTSEGLQRKGDEQLSKSNKHRKLQDSDSDATFIEDYEPSLSRHIAVERPTKDVSEELTELQSAKIPVNDVSALEEPEDTESQSLLENMQSDLSASKDGSNDNRLLKSKKKRKHKDVELGGKNENQDKLVNEDVAKNEGSLVLFEDNSTNWPLPVLCDDNIPRKKKRTRDRFKNKKNECIAENGVKEDLETTLRTALESVSCNTETEVNGQRPNEGSEQSTSCLAEPLNSDDGMICKKKKKHKKHKKKKGDLENAEIETTYESLQLDNLDNIAVNEEVSDVSDRKRKKHKKKREAASDDCNDEEDISLKQVKKKLKLFNTEENSLSKSVVSHEQSELVNHEISAPDSLTAQSDESVSVQKRKKKKKRQASFIVAETVENSHLPLSPFGNGHEADTTGISTNDIETESAETGGHLQQEPELGNRVKKKKKHRHDHTNEVYKKDTDHFGPNAKATETTNMSERKKNKCRSYESKECDSTEVAHPQSDESEQMKKKKKSKHERHHTVTEITAVPWTHERVEGEGYLMSPNPTENPVTKKKKKKKEKYFDNGDGVAEEKTVETTELEQNTAKRKKQNKDRIIDKDHSISSLLHGEMSPSSGSPVKRSRTMVKKKLYNPGDDLLE